MLFNIPRIYTLSSGSSGNCAFVSSGAVSLLIDAGISMRATNSALRSIGGSLGDISAIFITHEHSDHIKGLPMMTSKFPDIPVYVPAGSIPYLPADIDRASVRPVRSGDCVLIGDIAVTAFGTPHDSADSVGYTFTLTGRKFGLATDMGLPTKQVADALTGCERVIIEANYDRSMLEEGPYPYYLKQRIKSKGGHLENSECARMISYLALNGTTHFMLAHLSEANNTPEAALFAVRSFLDENNIKADVSAAARHGISCLIDESLQQSG